MCSGITYYSARGCTGEKTRPRGSAPVSPVQARELQVKYAWVAGDGTGSAEEEWLGIAEAMKVCHFYWRLRAGEVRNIFHFPPLPHGGGVRGWHSPGFAAAAFAC